jgi:hypothetical protein
VNVGSFEIPRQMTASAAVSTMWVYGRLALVETAEKSHTMATS